MDSGFRIPDSGFRIPDSGFRIPDFAFRILVSGFGFRILTLAQNLLRSRNVKKIARSCYFKIFTGWQVDLTVKDGFIYHRNLEKKVAIILLKLSFFMFDRYILV